MNRINFQQSVGFPLETDILEAMQTSWNILNALGYLVNDIAIIAGCEVVGSSTTDGVVFINGEVFQFRGGVTQDTVVIKQDITSREFEDGNTNEVLYQRYLTFGTATINQYNWEDFKRGLKTSEIQALIDAKANQSVITSITTRLDELEAKNAVFSAGGGMVLWQKPVLTIPSGWAEVVDWRGRLPIGYDPAQLEFNLTGKIGGAKTVTLTKENIPEHDHESVIYSGAKALNTVGTGDYSATGIHLATAMPGGGNINKTSKVGNGTAVNSLNPYRVAVFIEWVGI